MNHSIICMLNQRKVDEMNQRECFICGLKRDEIESDGKVRIDTHHCVISIFPIITSDLHIYIYPYLIHRLVDLNDM